jgi:hypothetical protein
MKRGVDEMRLVAPIISQTVNVNWGVFLIRTADFDGDGDVDDGDSPPSRYGAF